MTKLETTICWGGGLTKQRQPTILLKHASSST